MRARSHMLKSFFLVAQSAKKEKTWTCVQLFLNPTSLILNQQHGSVNRLLHRHTHTCLNLSFFWCRRHQKKERFKHVCSHLLFWCRWFLVPTSLILNQRHGSVNCPTHGCIHTCLNLSFFWCLWHQKKERFKHVCSPLPPWRRWFWEQKMRKRFLVLS